MPSTRPSRLRAISPGGRSSTSTARLLIRSRNSCGKVSSTCSTRSTNRSRSILSPHHLCHKRCKLKYVLLCGIERAHPADDRFLLHPRVEKVRSEEHTSELQSHLN